MKKIIILLILTFQSTTKLVLAQDIEMEFKGAPFGGTITDIEATSNGTLYAAAGSSLGLWKSTDNGLNWARVFTNTTGDNVVSDIEIDGADNIYVASSFFVYSSSDNGATWTRRNNLNTAFGGSTSWNIRQIKRTGSQSTSPMYALMSYNFSQLKQSIFKSIDNGTSWTEVFFSNVGNTESIRSIAVNASGNVFVVADNILHRSATGNAGTFTVVSSNIPSFANLGFQKQSMINLTGTLHLVVDDNIYSTTNGTTWVNNTPPGAFTNIDGALLSISGSNLYALTSSHLHFWNGSVWVSNALSSPTFTTSIIQSFKAVTGPQFFVGDNLGISASTNSSGTTWTLRNEGLAAVVVTGLTAQGLVSVNNNFYTQSNPVYSSTNDGESWIRNSSINSNAGLSSTTRIITYADGRFFATTNNQGYSSSNFGESWVVESPPLATTLMTNDGDNIYIFNGSALGSSVAKSTNRGINWTTNIVTGMPVTSFTVPTTSSFFYSDGFLYTVINDNSVSPTVVRYFKINVSTWQASEIPKPADGVQFNASIESLGKKGNAIFITSRNGIINQFSVSYNEGLSWVTQNISGVSSATFFMTQNGYPVFISTNGVGRISRDNGETWLSFSLGLTAGEFYSPISAIVSDDGYLNVMMRGSGFYRSTKTILLPEAPTNLVLTGSTFNQFRVMFNDNTFNETAHEIQLSVGNNTSYDSIGSLLSSNFARGIYTFAALPETTYYIKVRALNDAGYSAYSNELMVTTPAKCTTVIPDGQSWTLTTLNESGLGVRVENNVTISASRFNDFIFSLTGSTNGGGSFTGNVPAWPSPYPTFGGGQSSSLTINCNSVYITSTGLAFNNPPLSSTTNIYTMNGNGEWNATNNTITIRWKVNEATSNVTPFSEVSVLSLNANDPLPLTAPITYATVLDDTGIIVSWATYPAYAQEMVIERANANTGPWIEIGRTQRPTLTFVDRTSSFTIGQNYFYRIRGANSTGIGTNGTSVSVNFQRPLFRAITTPMQESYTSRLSNSWVDINNDGLDDLYFASGTRPAFLINKGNEVFELREFGAPEVTNYSYARFADFNNDGNLDFAAMATVTIDGSIKYIDEILTGDGQGNFNSVYKSIPFASFPNQNVQLLDYNRDGLLDVIFRKGRIVNNVGELSIFMLKNLGNNAFEEAFQFYDYSPGTVATTFGISIIDFDNDGITDVFMSGAYDNNTSNIRYYKGNNDNTFTLTPIPSLQSINNTLLVVQHQWGDVDNDGDFDLLVSYNGSPAVPRALFRNNGDGTFTSLTASLVAESSALSSAISSSFADINNDGALDILSTLSAPNNSATPIATIYLNSLNQNPSSFSGTGSGTFTKKENEYLTNSSLVTNGFTFGDVNNDGYLDVFSAWSEEQGRIFINNKVTTGNWLKINLIGVESNRSAIGSKIKVTAGSIARQSLVVNTVNSAFAGSNSLTQHFGLGGYTGALQIEVTWPSGKKQNVGVSEVNQRITITEDTNGPSFTDLVPANLATNVSVTIQIGFTLSENATPVANKRIFLYQASDLTTPIRQWSMSEATVQGNSYRFTLSQNLTPNTDFRLAIEAGAFIDVFGNESLASMASNWLFTTAEEIDVINPVVTFDTSPFGILNKGFTAQLASIGATDNKGVTSVLFKHRKTGDTNFNSVSATQTGESWSVQIQNTFVNDMGFEYFIEALDAQGNVGRSPQNVNTFHVSRTRFTETNTPKISINGDGTPNSWRIISIPYVLQNEDTQIATIFSSFGSAGGDTWRLLNYSNIPVEKWNEFPSNFTSIERGKGYFINTVDAKETVLDGAIAPDYSPSNLFSLVLVKGWNQIGNPYTLPLNWTEVKSFNNISGNIVGDLRLFTNGQYTSGNILQAGQGGFVLAENPITLQIPFPGQTTGARTKETNFSNRLDEEAWHLPLILKHNHINNTFAAVGMHPSASVSYDEFDDVNPPRFFDYAEINFDHAEHVFKRFTRDIVPTAQDHVWEFSVNSNLSGQASLSWDNTDLGNNGNEIMLVDVHNMQVINMRESNQYTVDLKQSSIFRIYFGVNLMKKIEAETFAVASAYPNPTSKETTVRFSLPKNGGEQQHVTLEVSDAMGKALGTVARGIFNSGYHSLSFDVSTLNKHEGLALISVNVVNATGRSTKQVKVVVNK
jgi:photosystem II stability/assembly factor-like uncharacterized protein